MEDFKIILNKIEWDIKFVPANSNVLDNNIGMCCYRTSTIYVQNDLKPTEMLSVLFHELSHACLAETYYNPEIKEGLGSEYEKFVSLLGLRLIELCEQKDKLLLPLI